MASLKGTYVAATVKALNTYRERALAELPTELHSYLERPVLTSKWYPAAEHFELLRALVKVSGIGAKGDPFQHLGRIAAKRDMRSTYKVLLCAGDPSATFQRLSSVWALGHDDGEMQASLEGSQEGVLELSGHEFFPPELCRLHSTFFSTTLELAGATDVVCRHTHCKGRGDGSCIWRCQWQAAPAA